MVSPGPNRFPLAFIGLAIVALAGAIDLAQPLAGDQSLFLLGAREMHDGAVLYRDFWDLKGPGIYGFYLVAGSLGGFSAFGIHVFELAYSLAFAAVVMFALRRFGVSAGGSVLGGAAAVVPAALFGTYTSELQVEALVGAPLFAVAWCCAEGTRANESSRRRWWFVAAGFSSAFVLALKLIFAPLLVLVIAATLAWRPRVVSDLVWLVLAVVLGTIPQLGYLYAHGALPAALATWFTIPPAIVASIPARDPHQLARGALWFLRRFAPLVTFGIVGIAIALRRKMSPLERAMLVWALAVAPTIVAQRTSWWWYQWLLATVPLGIFAATGIRETLRTIGSGRSNPLIRSAFAIAAVALLLVVPGRALVGKLRLLAAYDFASNAPAREAYRGALWPAYRGALADRDLLPRTGSLYVMGDPVYYLVTGRIQATRLNGWSLELLLPEQRIELERALRASPPAFVYRTDDDDGPATMLARAPSLAAYLRSAYVLRATGVFGRLYALRSRPIAAAASPRARPSPR